MADSRYLPCRVDSVPHLSSEEFDCVILVFHDHQALLSQSEIEQFAPAIQPYVNADQSLKNGQKVVALVATSSGGRLVLSSTGRLDRDFDDVRRFQDAANAAVLKALEAGSTRPILYTLPHAAHPNAELVALLGALQALHVPLEVRELQSEKWTKAERLGVFSPSADKLIPIASAIEAGKCVSRDIAASNPERMPPPAAAEYVKTVFESGVVRVEVEEDQKVIKEEFPMLAAVSRAANQVPRHQARLIHLQYVGEGPAQETLMLVGKGVTLDTGGLNVKTGTAMYGMSRDKGGAGAVAGFFKVLEGLRPRGLKAEAYLSMVRNSIDAESYSCDEVIRARSGKRVRIYNTDAEGRLAMLDPLCLFKEKALNEVNPHLFTVATLTGHALLTVGNGYSLAMDNGPALGLQCADKLHQVSELVGDIVEVSRLRREDYAFHMGESEYEDLRQGNVLPSTQTPRGHMTPAAFLILGSGLDAHGAHSARPLPYTHVDMAGMVPDTAVPSGNPVTALAARYILPRLA